MTPYYSDDLVTIWHGDCREVLPELRAWPLVVITDPPFNVGKDYGESQDDLPEVEYVQLLYDVRDKTTRHAWVTPTNRLSLFARLLGDDVRPVVVVRGAKGPKRWGWFDQFDLILITDRPRRYVSNLWTDIRLKGEGYYFREETFGHPGYTPEPIMARLVGLLAGPDDTVLDPFCGTGSTLLAAKRAGVQSVGIELDERWCEIAANRCRQEVLGLVG